MSLGELSTPLWHQRTMTSFATRSIHSMPPFAKNYDEYLNDTREPTGGRTNASISFERAPLSLFNVVFLIQGVDAWTMIDRHEDEIKSVLFGLVPLFVCIKSYF